MPTSLNTGKNELNTYDYREPQLPVQLVDRRRRGQFVVTLLALFCSAPAFCGEIHDAAQNGDMAKVREMLNKNPRLISSKDDGGRTPLHYAAGGRHKDVTQFLLANNADVNAKGNNGDTPLHWAAAASDGSFQVRLATGNKPDVSAKDVAQLLLANKAQVEAKDNDGSTPLYWAASNGNKDVVQFLLANKASANAKDDNENTALIKATIGNYKDTVQLLLASRADVNAKDKSGNTALHIAASVVRQPE